VAVALTLDDAGAPDAAEQAAFLRSVLDSATEYAIVAQDLDGRIVAWNEGARRIYGYEPAEVLGRGATLLDDPEGVERGTPRRILDRALAAGTWAGPLTHVRKSGTRFHAFVTVTPRLDGGGRHSGYTAISRELTDAERSEPEPRGAQDELRRTNDELREQYRRIEQANRRKSEFLANMSHELRTPLNAIIGFAELMHDGKVGPLAEPHREYLGDILSSSRHLLQLINDVLDLAKVESGKMEFRPEAVDLPAIVGEVRDTLRSLAAGKQIGIDVRIDPALGSLRVDPAKLKQVLYNYLSNALKFTPDGGRVVIRAEPEGPEQFRVEVEDSGIGIPPGDLERLFVEFQQLDAGAARAHAGTGLGLVLTKRIVEAQGGRVGVRSRLGEGSVFMASLPRAADGLPLDAPVVLAAAAAAEPTVLVVEDEPAARASTT
jgi:PAS domain S-box-containing protein